ncbi:uncharacterized protein RSE6_04162 [Rhynchosporium secalis]|uniref:Uncharacterized protein n=1 Tax=Rhynchosporium secalis TaxID=38038 RepID=A0A1E1M4K1_RHYSE|nr:uncharacterized protein RSE6_04162 [Rhynchosporium secalis]
MTEQNNRGSLGGPSSATYLPPQNQADDETSYLIAFTIFNQYTSNRPNRVDGTKSIFRDKIGIYHAEPSHRPPIVSRKLRVIRLNPSSTNFTRLRTKIEALFTFQDRNKLISS